MGKGKGKLAGWCTDVRSGIFLVEFKNLRYGRLRYYTTQFLFKLPVLACLVVGYSCRVPFTVTNSLTFVTRAMW